MRSILPATYRLNTKLELVTRRGVALTLVGQTFAEILRQITRPFALLTHSLASFPALLVPVSLGGRRG